MSASPRPYETKPTKDTIKQNIWWIVGGVTLLAVLGGLIWWGVTNSQKAKVGYTYTTLVNSSDAVVGKADSQYTLVLFEDYTCHVCASNHPDFNKVIDTYSDRIKIAYKPVDILKQGGDVISRAAYAAGNQGKFREYTTKAYELQTELRSKRDSTMISIAQDLQLDMTKFNEDRNFNTTYQNKVSWNDLDVQNTVFSGGVERSTQAEQPVTGVRIKEKNIGITATPTLAILKGDQVVAWWDGFADAATIGKRIDATMAN
jgi:Thioredoxin